MFNESNVIVNGGADLASTLQTYKTVVLKYNIVDGHNLLTQAMVSHTNTKYVIKWDYELAENITIPANCVLQFDGGSISGSHTITGVRTGIRADLVKIFNTDITLSGTWSVTEVYPEWFGAKGDGVTDDTLFVQKAFNLGFFTKKNICLSNTYNLSSSIKLTREINERGLIEIYGGGKLVTSSQISIIEAGNNGVNDIVFNDISFNGGNIAVNIGNGILRRIKLIKCTFSNLENILYSSDIIQDVSISYCTFLRISNFCFSGNSFYGVKIENCTAENGCYGFIYCNFGSVGLYKNVLEGFDIEDNAIVVIKSGSINATDNYIDYNKSNFIDLGGDYGTIYPSIISFNRQENERNSKPVVIIKNNTFMSGIVIVKNNWFQNKAFENNGPNTIIAYNNTQDGDGANFGKSFFKDSLENIIAPVPKKRIYSAHVSAPLSGINVCKIDPVNPYLEPLIKVYIAGIDASYGKAYIEAVYHNNTEISKTGTSEVLSTLTFTNNIININSVSTANFVLDIVIEIYGEVYITDYIN